MIRAIVFKELRENAWIAALALLLYLALVYELIPREKHLFNSAPAISYGLLRISLESIPFVDGTFSTYFIFISFAAAIGLGFRQATRESGQGTYLFLLHQPWSRDKVFLTKLLVGGVLLLACAAVPIVEYSWWAATPGDVAAPFEWSMTASCWSYWAIVPLAYLAAFLSGLRPARWYGTRLLPLVGLIFALLLSELLVQMFGFWFPLCALAILYTVFLWLILHVARTRDYS
jgi:hypothetical protein